MRQDVENHIDAGDPPGGILIWIIIYLELLTYFIAIGFLLFSSGTEASSFQSEASFLNKELATINTFVLITSGYLMANMIHLLKKGQINKAALHLWLTIVLGLIFILIKLAEYSYLISIKKGIGSSTFMDFYWSLTAFHLIHLIIGIIILTKIHITHRRSLSPIAIENYQAGASFWHLCDLIWILIYPAIYLNH